MIGKFMDEVHQDAAGAAPLISGGMCRVFSVEGRLGNPAFVLVSMPGEKVDEALCAAVSDRFGCEVTWAEWVPRWSQFHLRYFTSGEQISFCGHGTLAAAAWLAQCRSMRAPVCFRVGNGTIIVEQNGVGQWAYQQSAFPLRPLVNPQDVNLLLQSLGLAGVALLDSGAIKAFQTQGATRDKLVIGFADCRDLQTIKIRAAMRDDICGQLGATGIYVYAMLPDQAPVSLAARHFPVNSADNEDMATAAIAPTVAQHVLQNQFASRVTIFQGGAHCDHARLTVSKDEGSDLWRVGGECLVAEYNGSLAEGYFGFPQLTK